MQNKPLVRHEDPDQLDDTSVLQDELWNDLQAIFSDTNPLDVLPVLSGLLVAKWASHEEFKRETEAISREQAFEPVLPKALRLPAWEDESKNHAKAVFNALKEMNGRNGQESDIASYVILVKPSIAHLAVTGEKAWPIFKKLLSWVRRIDLAVPEVREIVFQLFDNELRSLSEKKGNVIGQFITPKRVADLMLELANPKADDKVYDPCFGYGGLLVGAARRIGPAAEPELFGVEHHQHSFAIGLCRILLAGVYRLRLARGDALKDPLSLNGSMMDGFDCILALPPWYLPAQRHPSAEQQPGNLFLQHVMAKLRPDGRAVVALPQYMLDRDGFRQVREKLLWGYSVDAVVSLPPGGFIPFARSPGCLVVFRRSPSPPVRFVRVLPKAWESALLGVADFIDRKLPTSAPSADVEIWDVPVSDLPNGHKLVVEKPGTEKLEEMLNSLKKAIPLESLHKVAYICQGISYDDSFTTQKGNAPDVVAGLLNVSDVQRAGARRPSIFLTREGKERLSEDDKSKFGKAILCAGDIVVTKAGEIGHVGLISKDTGTVGALPNKNMALVRTREKIMSQFLAVLLRSPVYQNWLISQRQGTFVRIEDLKKMRIPIPNKSIQKKVISEMVGVGGNALAVLARLLSGTEKDPVTSWLETPFVAQLAAGGGTRAPAGTEALTSAAKELLSLAAQIVSSMDEDKTSNAHHSEFVSPKAGDQQISEWISIARQAAIALDGLASIPRGTGCLAVLGVALSRLHEALRTLDKVESPTSDRLRSFTRAIIELSEKEVNAIQEAITLDIRVEPTEVPIRTTSEVQLHLTNSSAAPLRHLTVETEPPVGNAQIPYLAEGETRDVPLTVNPKYGEYGTGKPFSIGVSWQACRLDGTTVRGQKEVSLRVLFTSEADRFGDLRAGDLGASPYIVGSPVDRVEMFFGRTDVMERIKRQLGETTHANVILLEGNRRTGKTSILRQLEEPDALPGWIPVYCSLQGVDGDDKNFGVTTRDFFRLLVRETGWTLYDAGVETWFSSLPGPPRDTPFKLAFRKALNQAFADENAFETFDLYISSAIEAAKPKRILLMLDEFDKLQEGIDAGIMSPQVPENIRHLLQHRPNLSAIITGSRRLKRLREEYWSALFGLGHRIGISALPVDGAQRLVTEPVKERLKYLPQARDRLVELCACQPFLIQSLCNRVFEQAAAPEGTRTITLDIVEQAATEMVKDNEHFRTLWDYAGTERRRLILALCDSLAETATTADLNLLNVKLHEFGVRLRREGDLTDDITELLELELIDLKDSGRGRTYRLSVPLMARWLRLHVDINDLAVRAREDRGA